LTELVDGIFYATLNLRDASSTLLTLSARPSDAIALALRTKSNILATSELLEQVGIEIPDQGGAEGAAGEESQELERFREFLDQINPEDFAG
jgi:bifunctional DNase/RNase